MTKSEQIVSLEKRRLYFKSRQEEVETPQARIALQRAIEDVNAQLLKLGVKHDD